MFNKKITMEEIKAKIAKMSEREIKRAKQTYSGLIAGICQKMTVSIAGNPTKACTNGESVTLPLLPIEYFPIGVGFSVHEGGHKILTDFSFLNRPISKRKNPTIYPLLKGGKLGSNPYIFGLCNSLEDVWLEREMCKRLPGAGKFLRSTVEFVFSDEEPTNGGDDPYCVLSSFLLSYGRYHHLAHCQSLIRPAMFWKGRLRALFANASVIEGLVKNDIATCSDTRHCVSIVDSILAAAMPSFPALAKPPSQDDAESSDEADGAGGTDDAESSDDAESEDGTDGAESDAESSDDADAGGTDDADSSDDAESDDGTDAAEGDAESSDDADAGGTDDVDSSDDAESDDGTDAAEGDAESSDDADASGTDDAESSDDAESDDGDAGAAGDAESSDDADGTGSDGKSDGEAESSDDADSKSDTTDSNSTGSGCGDATPEEIIDAMDSQESIGDFGELLKEVIEAITEAQSPIDVEDTAEMIKAVAHVQWEPNDCKLLARVALDSDLSSRVEACIEPFLQADLISSKRPTAKGSFLHKKWLNDYTRGSSRVFARKKQVDREPPVVHLLVDTSGSMAGERGEVTWKCVVALKEALFNYEVPCGIANFPATGGYKTHANASNLVCAPMSEEPVDDLINRIPRDTGGTPIWEAISESVTQLSNWYDDDRSKILVVITDGAGLPSNDGMVTAAEDAGVSMFGIGIGADVTHLIQNSTTLNGSADRFDEVIIELGDLIAEATYA